MIRILLIFEDIAELNYTQTYLKKVGFDCVSMSSELGLSERILTVRPEVIVISCKGGKIHPRELASKLRVQYKYVGKMILMGGTEAQFSENEQIKLGLDKNLQPPVTPIKMIESICEVAEVSPAASIEKYQRSVAASGAGQVEAKGEAAKVADKLSIANDKHPVQMPTQEESKRRNERYKKAVEGLKLDSTSSTMRRADVRKAWRGLKADWDKLDESDLNDLKRKFATALFKKSK